MNDAQWTEWSVKYFGPPFAMLAIFVMGLVRKWWILGWVYEECRDEKNEWKAAYFRGHGVVATALGVAEKIANGASK